MTVAELENKSPSIDVAQQSVAVNPRAIRLDLAVIREEDGSCSVVVLNLPGVGSCGDSKEEAIEGAKQAVIETLATYPDHSDVPWATPDQYEIPDGAERKRVLMNV
jgi:predicted RNase H-like HicB family nuclease